MRFFPAAAIILLIGACAHANETATPEFDREAEMAAIEETRTGFQQAIKERRYADLAQYATADMITLTPVCGDWAAYKALIQNPQGQFSYDSIRMEPKETVLVSDSVAYDYGTSKVYYTDTTGQAVEITASFLVILKKDKTDGVWKLHREVATTNSL